MTLGTVTRTDRPRREITIRFDNGTNEVLTLAGRAAAGAARDLATIPGEGVRIAVYYRDAGGGKVVHDFRRVS